VDKDLSLRTGRTLWLLPMFILAVSLTQLVLCATSSRTDERVTPIDAQAVTLAIQDEMYDEGCQGYVADLADEHQGENTSRMHVYIQPALRTGTGAVGKGEGWLIYKFRPLGEVFRLFWFKPGGLVMLGGHPEWNFPPTEPSYLTIYMDDDELCKFKREWLKVSFTIDLKPSQQRLREAIARQKIRWGSNYRPHKRDCSFGWR